MAGQGEHRITEDANVRPESCPATRLPAEIGGPEGSRLYRRGISVQLKGKVACEIHSADELVLTELILENVLAK